MSDWCILIQELHTTCAIPEVTKISFSCYLPIGSFIEILNRSLNYSGKFVAKNLTFLPCIGLSESRMRGVVHVLGILNNFFELYSMNIPALS
jgi:hypothetical protein